MAVKDQRRTKIGFIDRVILESVKITNHDRKQGLQYLVSLFSEVRPTHRRGKTNAEKNLQKLTEQIRTNKLLLENTQQAFISQLLGTDLKAAITKSGIPLARGFWQELLNRFKHKLLPVLQNENDFLYVVDNIFYKKNDYKWVEAISRTSWIAFFEMIGFNFSPRHNTLQKELTEALRILSFQVAQLGLEQEILEYLPGSKQGTESAFIQQNYIVHELERLLNAQNKDVRKITLQLKDILADCYSLIEQVRDTHTERGASIQQTYLLLILSNRLERMQLIIDVLDADNEFDTGRFVDIFKMLIRNEKTKNSIREFFSQGIGYLAYQIAEHKGSKGGNYITSTIKEYYRMIVSAMKGGLIISFIAILKNLIAKLNYAPIPMGFLYSVNYSIGFIAIENTGSTLATKQPAFTASAVASSLDMKKYSEPDLNNLAVTVAKVSRSQIASFFGNLVIVFPITYILAWAYQNLFGEALAQGEGAMKLLIDQHPWRSPALLYACFTGFFLFASGIIAGYWQNKIRYGRIRLRLQKHPVLKRSMSFKNLSALSAWVENNFGALAGNIALGFFLGFAGILGHIFGVPFDIRHITISAGNSAIGVYSLGLENIPPYFLLAVLGGILLIGFLNFFVSFSLAFFVAVKSRGIRFSQYPVLFKIIANYFISHPREFFLPPKKKKPLVYKGLNEKK